MCVGVETRAGQEHTDCRRVQPQGPPFPALATMSDGKKKGVGWGERKRRRRERERERATNKERERGTPAMDVFPCEALRVMRVPTPRRSRWLRGSRLYDAHRLGRGPLCCSIHACASCPLLLRGPSSSRSPRLSSSRTPVPLLLCCAVALPPSASFHPLLSTSSRPSPFALGSLFSRSSRSRSSSLFVALFSLARFHSRFHALRLLPLPLHFLLSSSFFPLPSSSSPSSSRSAQPTADQINLMLEVPSHAARDSVARQKRSHCCGRQEAGVRPLHPLDRCGVISVI